VITELEAVTSAYACARSATIRSHPVRHARFRALSAQFGRLLSRIEDAEDPYWLPLLRHMRRIRFELAATPIPFSSKEFGFQTANAAIAHQYAGVAAVYPHVAPAITEILAAANDLTSGADAPLLARLAELVDTEDFVDAVIVLCETRLVRVTEPIIRAHPSLRRLTILSAVQLRALRCYPRLLCVGSARWFPGYITAAPRAPMVEFIHFHWTPGPTPSAPLFSIPAAVVASQTDNSRRDIHVSEGLADTIAIDADPGTAWFESDAYAKPGTALLNDLVYQASISQGTSVHRHDMVRVLPIALEGGRAVFLDAEDGSSALVLDLAERGKSQLRRMPTLDIEEGMFVLLRAGGGGDYVVPVADAVLGKRAEDCRRLQREWKTRLRIQALTLGLFEASIALLDHGSVRADEGNVRRWMWERSIRPRDYADFLAIMRLIGLADEASHYWSAMAQIDSAHIKAGQLIRRMLLEQVMKADLTELERIGSMEFDLPARGTGRMIACRAIGISEATIMVAASHAGRLFAEGEMLWQS
jgi:hypothetical protein